MPPTNGGPAMRQQAREILDEWNADVAIVGSVRPTETALDLWFLPIVAGNDTLDQRPYVLNNYNATLPERFREDLRAQLVATALSAASSSYNEEGGQVLTEAVVEKIENLLPTMKASEQAGLNVAAGNALATLGAQELGSARLEAAVEAYSSALKVFTREHTPDEWAAAQNGLGRRPPGPGAAGTRDGAARSGGRGPLQRPGGVHAAGRAGRLGHDPEEPRQRPPGPGGAGTRDGAARSGGRGLFDRPRRGVHARTPRRTNGAAAQNDLGHGLLALGEREPGRRGSKRRSRPI